MIKRAIEKGQTVAASLQSPELFVIAQNLRDMQVDASIDESDVGRIRTGQHATFTVDAFPGQTFEGEVRQVRKAAQNVANVVTYVAVVGFSNTGGRLLPGMTANVRVVTESRESVLKIPNAALRVRIAGVEPAAAPAGAAPAARPASGAAAAGSAERLELAAAGAGPAGQRRRRQRRGAMRERLVSELRLSVEQQGKLDAIAAEMRPAVRGPARPARRRSAQAAREKVLMDMRDRIHAMLTPEQKCAARACCATRLAASRARARESAASSPSRCASAAAAPRPAAAPAPARRRGQPGERSSARGCAAELRLTPSQLEKVDAIYADVRPRFMQLRDLPAEERPKARERISAEVRARIGDLLTPEQKPGYAAILAESGGRATTRGRIYLLADDGKPRAFNVRLGITDGTSTELIVAPSSPDAAELKEGADRHHRRQHARRAGARPRGRPARACRSDWQLGDGHGADRSPRPDQGLRHGRPDRARAARRVAGHRGGRVRRDHGRLGLGQVHADEHPGLPGPADRRANTGWPARRWRPWAPTSWRRSATAASASCSSSSTCCRAPARWRTSNCRWSIRASRPRCGASARWPRCARWAWASASATRRRSCRAASSSAWRSRGRWSTTRN